MSDRDLAIEALSSLSAQRAEDRDSWLQVGMVLHSVSPDLLEHWDEWSRQSEKYKSGECARQWKSFKADGGLGLGSLVEWVREDSGDADFAKATAPSSRSGRSLNEAIAYHERTLGECVAHWCYGDAEGHVVLSVARFEKMSGEEIQKDYRPLHLAANGWKTGDPKGQLPLYRLPDLAAADRVFVCEGEKVVDAIRELGLFATTSAHGAPSPKKTDWSPLAGKQVVVLPDNDEPGRKYATTVLGILAGLTPPVHVKVVGLPELPPKGDAVEFIENLRESGASRDLIRDQFEELAAVALAEETGSDDTDRAKGEAADDDSDGEDPKGAALLVALAEDELESLFHDARGDSYATIRWNERFETWRLRDRSFKTWLARLYFEKTKKAASPNAISEGTRILEGRALFDGDQVEVEVRIGQQGSAYYLDLGDAERCVLRIDASGVEPDPSVPVRFRRPAGFKGLPQPAAGGDLRELRRFINCQDSDWPLIAGWLVAAARPVGPYPLLVLLGQKGSAKTTTARVLRGLIDPNAAPIRSQPRDERDLVIAASNCHVLAFDNISKIAPWLSDALCRLATGGGAATRRLYTDDEETIFDAQRPTILTGIDDIVGRSDLLDRSLLVSLPVIEEDQRRTEEEFWAEFEEARPRIFRGFLNAVSIGLSRKAEVKLDRLPRMADFAVWAVACEPGFAVDQGEFLRAYAENRESSIEIALESSPLAMALRGYMTSHDGDLVATASELLDILLGFCGLSAPPRTWPKSGRGVSSALRQVAPDLRAGGIRIEFGSREPGGGRRRLIRVWLLDKKDAGAASPGGRSGGTVEPSRDPAIVPQETALQAPGTPIRDGWDDRDGCSSLLDIDGQGPTDVQPDTDLALSESEIGLQPSRSSQPSPNLSGDSQSVVSSGRKGDDQGTVDDLSEDQSSREVPEQEVFRWRA